MEIGERIRKIRKQMHVTQKELSTMTGISQSSISDIEKLTNNPSSQTLLLIAQALSCSVSELLGEQENGTLTLNEKRLVNASRMLNDAGVEELIRYAGVLSGNILFTEKKAISSAV